MNRRNFLRALSGFGVALLLPKILPTKADFSSAEMTVVGLGRGSPALELGYLEMSISMEEALKTAKTYCFNEPGRDYYSQWVHMDTMKAFMLTPSEWEELALEDRARKAV